MSWFAHPWLQFVLAVLVASVLGSMHCVGMCGPFALWAAGAGGSRRDVLLRMTLYHLGRLSTYLVGGLVAGSLGIAISAGGAWMGVQSMAARVAGVFMITLALIRLIKWLKQDRRPGEVTPGSDFAPAARGGTFAHPNGTGRISIAGGLAKLRPTIQRLPIPLRAWATGALTTMLPCGWLYLFLLVAGGTGSIGAALTVMFAFWLGTLPALTLLMLGALGLAPRLRPVLPLLGTMLLFLTGLYTVTGRAAADMTSLGDRVETFRETIPSTDGDVSAAALSELSQAPLPCCSSEQ